MQQLSEHIQQEIGPAHSWVSYLEWLGVKVEGPQTHREREE